MKVKIITQGCSLNFSDSETIKGILKEEGFNFTDFDEEADLIVYNTCTVKGPTELLFRKRLNRYRKMKKPVVIAGCIPQAQKTSGKGLVEFKDCSVIGINSIHKIGEVAKQTLEGNFIHILNEDSNKDRLNLPFIRKNKFVEILPINEGCLGNCAYCKTKQARGKLKSYPVKDLTNRIRNAINDGVKEIWLTSQDTGTYGLDIGTNIGELLLKILEKRGTYRIRLGMSNPHFAYKYRKQIVKALKDERMFKFLHLPLQSGNNAVLKSMNRPYTKELFLKTIQYFRKEIPNITIATDIICGFPTETEDNFEETLDVVKQAKFEVINISMFWPREGTKAAEMEQIPSRISKERTRTLTKLFINQAKTINKKWIGQQQMVLIDEVGKNNSFVARNNSYRPVILEKKKGIELGQFVKVNIKDSTAYDLRTF